MTSELASLAGEGFSMEILGFGDKELSSLMGGSRVAASDLVPEGYTQEINPDEFAMDHQCPKCGMEFNDPA